ncbi:MAG: hypothetical protein U0457_05025 [Candidatus Sericytochromatia bacterium]
MKKITYLLIFILLFSCNYKNGANIYKNNIMNNQNIKNKFIIKGKVEFPNFRLKDLNTDITKNATVSLLYPYNYSVVSLRNSTIATGLTDSNGNFQINPNNDFTPKINDIFVIETYKRLNGVVSSNMSFRTNLMWDGENWKSITKPNLVINKKTTAIALHQFYYENFTSLLTGLNYILSETIDKIDLNLQNNLQVGFNSKLREQDFLFFMKSIEYSINENKDPITNYTNNIAKESAIKSNMHTFQTIVETYAVDWAGLYAPNLQVLKQSAQTAANPYWQNAKNPYGNTITSDYVIDYDEYIQAKNTLTFRGNSISNKDELKGLVLYKPEIDSGYFTRYWIYGVNFMGELIQDYQGNSIALSNY